ncbi:nucleotide exchange factor GrpE [Halanaerobium congolense]|jgi:molecular chaperone GrpE (heat shock protein)|nr:nucleotide exchange factor GrpE [Halanaerobium congolense]SDH90531.1 Molecular chaperone GrpE (heat shock protein) [Halanaerobium congolense]SDL00165.1 Molecular chaperone GrpE (heat shock protein) [Halanaerobium congolense]SDN04185.1 Molecular chaperone GrpE (heat shock protein) [Halanaerobium congolense]SHN11639.1 Molecular chaperone GrpE (heat shock protein) [Halanaerobium congolense]
MNWKFWQNDDQQKLLEKIENLTEKVNSMEEKINDLDKSEKKMNRLQYKQNQDLFKKIDELSQLVNQQRLDQELISKLKSRVDSYSLNVENSSKKIIELIDEFDLLKRGLDSDENSWSSLLENWSQRLLKLLEQNDIYQLNLKEKEFDPRRAEALTTVNSEALTEYPQQPVLNYNNNQIVEVIKRGYQDQEDNILRKSQVVVYKEAK